MTIPAALVGLVLAWSSSRCAAEHASPIGADPRRPRRHRDLTLDVATGARAPAPARTRRPDRHRRLASAARLRGARHRACRDRCLAAARARPDRRGSGGDVRAFDPFLALSPVLVGVAVALVTIRLYPYPVRAIGWLAARGAILSPCSELRTIGRDPTAAYLPLLVLMLTVAIGTFPRSMRVTVDRGQVDDSWRQVGADYRIENRNGGTRPRVDPKAIPGVGPIAAGYAVPAVPFVLSAGRAGEHLAPRGRARRVRGGHRGQPVDRPIAFASAPTGATAGTADDPIPRSSRRTHRPARIRMRPARSSS